MWEEGVLTDGEGGGPITVDSAGSYQKDKNSGVHVSSM